jgi:hypothetical protein
MTTSTGRSPPILSRVTCPFCGRFWFRHHYTGTTQEIEILCRGASGDDCRKLITFRMVNGAIQVETVMDRNGNPIT